MIFTETRLKGVFLIEPELAEDDRGFFARIFCCREFEAHGLNPNLRQCNISFNKKKGTLRGMHFQAKPREEAKLVRCTNGVIFDVVIDLRPESDTFKQWFGVNLSAENRTMLYAPEGFAHGFLTLQDESEVFYQMSEFHHPECAQGARWDDPSFRVEWPLIPKVISEKDRAYRDFIEFENFNEG